MATYNSKNDDTVLWGREFKLNVSMEPWKIWHRDIL